MVDCLARKMSYCKDSFLIGLTPEAVIPFAAMDGTRSYLKYLAPALLILVLLNGMACSIGHGQMLQKMFAPSVAFQSSQVMSAGHAMAMDHSHHHLSTASANQLMPPMPGMDSPFSDCFFAASLPLGLILFAVLGWLLRRRPMRPIPHRLTLPTHPTALLLSLHPRAP